MPNETTFNMRIDEKLRADFIAACKSRDMSAAQEVRQFMRDYIRISTGDKTNRPENPKGGTK